MTNKLSTAEWLWERYGDCMRHASRKSGDERKGWIEDSVYFATAYACVREQEARVKAREAQAGDSA